MDYSYCSLKIEALLSWQLTRTLELSMRGRVDIMGDDVYRRGVTAHVRLRRRASFGNKMEVSPSDSVIVGLLR